MFIFVSLYRLAEIASEQPTAPAAAISLPLVFAVGFVAAAALGSIAWYNSKRPPGWEDKERPEIVPEVEKEETPGLGTPNP
jgi:hypothetical protein